MIQRAEGKPPKIVCDVEGCTTKTPSQKSILKAGGLNRMGWQCLGGTHLCPDHLKEKTSV